MKNKIKTIITLQMVLFLSLNNFATSVSDNDGSAFITKAEFDALKSNFQSQIDIYNTSIDSKIDAAIASYLSGISISTTKDIKLDINQNLGFPVYSCVGKESSKHTYKEAGDARYDLSLPQIENQTSEITSSNNSSSSADTGLRVFTGHTTAPSYNHGATVVIDLVLNTYHSDPRLGNYESAVYDTLSNKWRTKGYKNGYIKSGSEFKVQDLTINRLYNDVLRTGVYWEITDGWGSKWINYVYLCMLGSNANNLYNTNDSTTFSKWYGDTGWRAAMASWFSIWNNTMTNNQKNWLNNFTGKNIKLSDLKTGYTNAGYSFWSDTSRTVEFTLPTSSVRERIETDTMRNKIYSGADAYVNAFPESSIWCYNPTKIDGSWKSDEYELKYTYKNVFFTTNYTKAHPGSGVVAYNPNRPICIPALDGDTNDENFAKTAKFSIIKADKLYWTDDNGEDHKFNEGLFITKMTNDGSLIGKIKFTESSGEKVWCAFSKKPFDGSWTDADALSVDIKSEGTTQVITNFLYECDKEYVFNIEKLSKDDKIYMCFKSSSGTKNPSLDYINDLQVKTTA